ncbi:MAG: HupE/UreJ family protein [Acidobacteria bacterium]|nr:HupE/UreJ family protein [Acidobacteriota bacterium]
MGTSILAVVRSASGRRWLIGPTLCAVVVAFLCCAVVRAHEIGTTRVSVLFFQQDRTYEVKIVTDAVTLVEKLEASTGGPVPADTSPAHLQALLTSFDEKFRQRVNLAFDSSEVRPVITYSVAPASDALLPAVATIRLTGQIPPEARHFTWNYSWTFAAYSLTSGWDTSEKVTTEWLDGGQSSAPFTLTPPTESVDRLGIAWRYFTLGFTHIVPYGLDHILFVLGIYLLSNRARSVLWQVSAFTIAHSITLGLSMYGLIALSPKIVEPFIALSIVYVAIENIYLSELKSWRVALVFAFGLLHGMGFAGVLQELGLPRSEFVMALLTFNIGVEAGQLAVIGAAFLLVGWYCAHRDWYRRLIVVPASMLIACIAVYWTIQRVSF